MTHVCDSRLRVKTMILKDFAVALICLLMPLLKGNAANIPQVIVDAGKTAKMYYHRSANETSDGFRSYKVSKNLTIFSYIARGSNTGICTDDELKMFCTEKTSFSKYNGSHLLLEINKTELNDTGSYEVHVLFKKLDSNALEQILLKVIHLKVDENTTAIPPSVRSTEEHNQSTASSTTAPSVVNSDSFPCTGFSMTRVVLLVFLLFVVI